ncbi:MAG: hypothetical protein WDA75_15885 [Candidatus Latescibacterota bacterium]
MTEPRVRGRLFGALLIARLALRRLPADLGLVMAQWRPPAIEVVVERRRQPPAGPARLIRRLNEVYPF